MTFLSPLSEQEKTRFSTLNKENVDFLRSRYNKVNRWVIADMVRRSAYRYPNKTALIYNDMSLNFSQLEQECNRFANALLDLGIKKYDRVAIVAHNTIHHVITWLGTAKAGGVYLALNYMLKGKDISFCINHSESKVFVIEDSLYGIVKDVLNEMPGVKAFVWSNQGEGKEAPGNFKDFDTWYKEYPVDEPDVELNIEDPVQMAYTSGTETLPKGVVLTNQNLLSEYTGSIIDGEYSPEDVNLNALPIFHCAQRDVFLNPCLMLGCTNILIPQPDPKQIMEYIQKHKATMFFAPPTVWIGLLRHPDFEKYDLSTITKGYYGASIMPVEVLKELQQRFPDCKRFYNYYGQTELSPYHTILKPEFQISKAGAAGIGGLNMESRIEDENHEQITTAGVPGEICGRGPHALLCYYKEPEKTEEIMANGWFHSGDIGVLDEDNFITVVDRKKDMVKTGGENVPSREVEEVIYKDSRVSEVAVVGLPHEKWVEAVTAIVVPKSGESIQEDEIINLCKENLAGFKVPKGVIFQDELPKNPSGKILKRNLREIYKNKFVD
jgi:fatty-acyl-CoA synthase